MTDQPRVKNIAFFKISYTKKKFDYEYYIH